MDTNVIYCGDNLEVLPKYIPDDSVDLIYIDPPFNSSRNYEVFWGEAQERRAFEDRFGDAMAYLDWMRPRIVELHRVLKLTGTFWYHCDWHASHYVKVELDRVFGANNFVNEIIWRRTSARSDSHRINHIHDTIFLYGKTERPFFNPQFVPYDEGYIERFYRNIEAETGRRFMVDNLTAAGTRNGSSGRPWHGVDVTSKGIHWKYTIEGLEKLDKVGRIYWPPKGKVPRYKRYLDEMPGLPLQSVWMDIPPIQAHAGERLGYPTQKPLALLERIVKSSSDEGQIVLDAFCGCGTTLEAAAKYKRRWIGIDMSPTACRVMAERLYKRLGLRDGIDFNLIDMPKTEDDLRRLPHREFENWAVIALGGIPNKVKVGDYGIDGRLYLADIEKQRKGDFFETLDRWYPIQVKQQDRVGRPDIDNFQTAMRRDKRLKGYFVAFGFSRDSIAEIKRANTHDGLDIVPITVKELLQHERVSG